MQLKRPILVGGLGLSASLWLLNIVGHSPVGHALGDGAALIGAIALSAGVWFLQKSKRANLTIEAPLALKTVDKSAVEKTLAGVEATLTTLIEALPEERKADC
ncbi:MAG: hypothetical protein ACFB16_10070 [Phormidesmis sp.]